MKATFHFFRDVAGVHEDMGSLFFLKGDYYNIYHHVTMDSGFEKDPERILQMAGFRVIDITETDVVLEKIKPPFNKPWPSPTGLFGDNRYKIKLGEKLELHFERYGIYTIILKSIEENKRVIA